jgi:hypothetical protein
MAIALLESIGPAAGSANYRSDPEHGHSERPRIKRKRIRAETKKPECLGNRRESQDPLAILALEEDGAFGENGGIHAPE